MRLRFRPTNKTYSPVSRKIFNVIVGQDNSLLWTSKQKVLIIQLNKFLKNFLFWNGIASFSLR